MTLTFLPEAAAELYESAVYYQAKEAGWRSASAMNSPKSSQRFVATPIFGANRRVDIAASIAPSFLTTSPILSGAI